MADFIIIIRAEPDASRDVAWLKRYQVPAIAVPVMHAESWPFSLSDVSPFQAIVFTSRYAVAAVASSANIESLRSLPTYVVGRSTAIFAREAGFNKVITGEGDGRGLLPVLVADLHPNAGALLWPSAVNISFDIVTSLGKFGFVVKRVPVYAMPATIPADTCLSDCLAAHAAAAVVAMSARSIDLFSKLLTNNQLDACRDKITVIAGSQSIATAAGSRWADILIAKAPRRSRVLTIARFIHRRRRF